MDESRAADPLPPAFFPVSLNLAGRRCVVIGADDDAAARVEALRACGGAVEWVRDVEQLSDSSVRDAFLVISTPRDAALSERLRKLADDYRVLLCTIDQPAFGFVAMQAVVAAGPARISISTGGVAPRVGKVLKLSLERALGPTFARFLDCLGTQRRRNRARLESVAERREAMLESSDGFEVRVEVRYPAWFRTSLDALGPSAD
jgi:siroheme synthase (precorrin-2 oxidase/ferrochelatase)